jgi:hypothetical protein
MEARGETVASAARQAETTYGMKEPPAKLSNLARLVRLGDDNSSPIARNTK